MDDDRRLHHPLGSAARLSDRYHRDGAGAISQERLLVLLYQRILRDLDDAVTAMESGDHETAHFAIVHAQEIVAELDAALDPDAWEGAIGLSELYGYMLDLLVAANLRKDPRLVRECSALVRPIADAWAAAWTEVSSASVGSPSSGRPGAPRADDSTGNTPRALDVMG